MTDNFKIGDRVRVTHGSYLSELPIEGTIYSTTETKVFEDRVHRFLVEVPKDTMNGSNHLAGRTVIWASHVESLEPSAGGARSVRDLQAEVQDLQAVIDAEQAETRDLKRKLDAERDRAESWVATSLVLNAKVARLEDERDEARAEAEAAGDTLTYALQMLDDEQRQRVAGFYDGVKQ